MEALKASLGEAEEPAKAPARAKSATQRKPAKPSPRSKAAEGGKKRATR